MVPWRGFVAWRGFWLLPLSSGIHSPGVGAEAGSPSSRYATGCDSCEDRCAVPPTGLFLAAPDRLSAVQSARPGSVGARPTEGIYACLDGAVKPINHKMLWYPASRNHHMLGLWVVPSTAREAAPCARGRAVDARWTSCGRATPRYPGGRSRRSTPRRLAAGSNVRAILPRRPHWFWSSDGCGSRRVIAARLDVAPSRRGAARPRSGRSVSAR